MNIKNSISFIDYDEEKKLVIEVYDDEKRNKYRILFTIETKDDALDISLPLDYAELLSLFFKKV